MPPDALIALRVLLALVFLVAAAGKLGHREELEGVIANYRVLPRVLAGPFSRLLAPLELLIGLALLAAPLSSPFAEIAAAVLLAAFALAIGINLRRGRTQIDCGCFRGTLRQSLRIELVLRNLLLLAAALLCALMPVTGASHWQFLNGLLGGVAFFVLLQGINTLWTIDTRARRGSTRSAWASRSAS